MQPGIDRPRAPIEPLRSDFKLDGYSAQYLDRLLEEALQILLTTGVRVLSPKAVAILKAHGADIDERSRTARLAADLVMGAVAAAPRSFVLGSRDGSCDLDLAADATYMTADGCGDRLVDRHSGETRRSTKADLADITRLLDYLSSISFWWPILSAGDCGETAQLHELDAGWGNTVKHLQGMVQGEAPARYAVEMATIVAESPENLRRRPVLSNLVSTVSPLVVDRDAIEAALVFAEAGVPVVACSAPTLGTTAPATLSGAYAVGLAEVLASVAIIQLAVPGAPTIGYVLPQYADPRTGKVAAHRDLPSRILATELIHHVGLPALSAFDGAADARRPGSWEAAAHTASWLMTAACGRTELAVGLGLIDHAMLWAAENLILDDHLYHHARRAFCVVPLDDESLALDVIDTVGPGGHYLAQSHTRHHLRDIGLDAITLIPGDGGGYRDAVDVAREQAADLLQHYQPLPLEEEKREGLAKILRAADSELRT
jgi:trimethylamine---corrinoid protein Co-methyltransferase